MTRGASASKRAILALTQDTVIHTALGALAHRLPAEAEVGAECRTRNINEQIK